MSKRSTPAWLPCKRQSVRYIRFAVCAKAIDTRHIKQVIDQRSAKEKEISQIHVRSGIATGEVTLSSAAAGERVVLTVAGDTVNAAARIEQLGKNLQSYTQEQLHLVCLVDETTRIESHLPEEFFSFHGAERLRGRSIKTNLYELMTQ